MTQGKGSSNYPDFLTHRYVRNVLRLIQEVRFSVDLMAVSIRYKGIGSKEFLDLLGSQFHATNGSPEQHTGSRAYQTLFTRRTWYELGAKSSLLALTVKARALSYIDALIVLNNPSAKEVVRLQKLLRCHGDRVSFALAGCELAFDFVSSDSGPLLALKKLIKSSCYFRHARVGFSKGVFPHVTEYINSRKSIKQLKVYRKDEDYPCLRVEFSINRRKANQQGLKKPSDLLTYRLGLLDEIGFYRIDFGQIETGLFDGYTQHHFSRTCRSVLRKRGFQQALVWARSQWGCPRSCADSDSARCCYGMFPRVNFTGKEMFDLIQGCLQARRLVNFKRDNCSSVEGFGRIKKMMKRSFERWKLDEPSKSTI